jgi:hypothetical protein
MDDPAASTVGIPTGIKREALSRYTQVVLLADGGDHDAQITLGRNSEPAGSPSICAT